MDELKVKLLDKESIYAQLEVYMIAFESDRDVEDVRKKWESKHYHNPYHESYVFGVYDGERLVSINAYMPMKYRYKDQDINVIQSCESGTIPEYRGKGLWSKVVTYAIEYFKNENKYDFLIGFPNYENSYGGFMKMKWSHTSDVINYILVGNGKQFVKAITGKYLPLSKAAELQRFALGGMNKSKYVVKAENDVKFNGKVSGNDIISLMVDDSYLAWRKEYKDLRKTAVYDKTGRLLAECYFALAGYKDCRIVYLYKVYSVTGDCLTQDVFATCVKSIISQYPDIAFVRTWTMAGSEDQGIIKRLFLKSGHHNPFITYMLKKDIVTDEIVNNPEKWLDLSFMDLD